ncbi:MAG: hypothetical protein WBN75_12040 [Verrucomicrobiia bacterium]
MREFDPHLVLLQCCPNPLGEDLKREFEGKSCYRMIMTQLHCSWGRGFYFQPIILEYSFQDYFPNHSSKTTIFFNRWRKGENKKVSQKDGSFREYPVLAFYICVNRDRFRPLAPHQNKTEWLKSIAPRTEAIAHELLYADQYAKNFDITTGDVSCPIQLPSPDQEDELLCPTYQIEASIATFEHEAECFKNEADFISQQATETVQKYYNWWLETYGVAENICHRRTRAYLKTRFDHKRVMKNALDSCMAKHGIKDIDPIKFKNHVFENTPFVNELFVEVTNNGCPYTKVEIISHTVLLLNKNNGHVAARP